MTDHEMLKRLKFGLLARGINVSRAAHVALGHYKPALRTRSGVSGGLDLRIADDVYVNCELNEARTAFLLDFDGEEFSVRHPWGQAPAALLPTPTYYGRAAHDGTPLVQVGQMCSADRICVGMTRHCALWRRDLRCTFCSIGSNVSREAGSKSPELIAEAVNAAAADPAHPATHVLVGGGTPNLVDMGAELACAICQAIKRVVDLPIYVMIVPPTDLAWIDRLKESGADELGLNIEFGTQDALARYAPGKAELVGWTGYLRALEHAVLCFGPVNTRSILIAGLEPAKDTECAAIELASRGVMPILSPFRALAGTDLSAATGWDGDAYVELYDRILDGCRPFGIVPGPTCIPCQNNTLSMPFGDAYQYY